MFQVFGMAGLAFGILAMTTLILPRPVPQGFTLGFAVAAVACFVMAALSKIDFAQPVRAPAQPRQARQGPGLFDGLGAGAMKHGWLIAGILLAVLFAWSFMSTLTMDEKVNGICFTAILLAASILCLATYTGNLGVFMAGLVRDYKALTFMLLSLFAALVIGRFAYEEGYNWHTYSLFWIAIVCAVLAGLVMANLMVPLLKKAGEVILKAFGFGYHPFLSLVLWGILLMGGGVLVVLTSHHEVFDNWDGLSAIIQETFKWVIGVGFFLIVMSPLVFKKK